MPVTLRRTKGSALTHQEMDANFEYFDQDAIRADLLNTTSPSKSASLLAYLPSIAYTDGLGAFLNYTFARTAEEVTAGVVPTNYAFLPGDPKRYGAMADWNGVTGTDDTPAFRLLKAVVNAGQKTILFCGRRYRLATIADNEILLDIANVSGITVFHDGAEFAVDRTFTGSAQCKVFRFAACNGITYVGLCKPTCTQSQPANQHTDRGPVWTELIQGCVGFKADITDATDFREVYHTIRGQTDPRSYACRNLHFGLIRAYRCGYPLSGSLSGYNVTAAVDTEECGRSFFWTGGEWIRVLVRSKNNQASADCLLTSDPCDDSGSTVCQGLLECELWYVNEDSTTADNSLNCVNLQAQESDLYVTTHRNVKVHLQIKNSSASNYRGFGFCMSKTKHDDTGDTTDRGHVYDGITVSGSIIAASGNQRSIATQSQGTFGAGDIFRDFKFDRLRLEGTGQPNFIFAALEDSAIFENLYYTSTVALTGSSKTGSRVSVLGANVAAWSVSGGFVYMLDRRVNPVAYSSSITFDAWLANRHIISVTNGSAFTVNNPTNPAPGQIIALTIENNSGGVMGTPTFGGEFKMAAWGTAPATGFKKTITFERNGSQWDEVCRSTADIPV